MDAVNVKVQAVGSRLAHRHAPERLPRSPGGNRVSDRMSCSLPVVLRALGVAPRDAEADAVPTVMRGIAQLPRRRRLLALRCSGTVTRWPFLWRGLRRKP
jgi:hypothetical protein